jgi:O-antigen/teichoic acid export membrane protein
VGLCNLRIPYVLAQQACKPTKDELKNQGDALSMTTEPENNTVHREEISRTASNAAIAGVGAVVTSGVNYASGILITRFVGPQGFGVFSLAYTIANLAGILSRVVARRTVLRYVALYNGLGDIRKAKGVIVFATRMTIALGLVCGLALFVSSDLLAAQVFHEPDLSVSLKIFAVIIPALAVLPTWSSALQGIQAIKSSVFVESILLPGLRLALLIVSFVLGWKLLGVLSATAIAIAVSSLASLYYLVRSFPLVTRVPIPELETREWLLFSLPLFLEVLLLFAIKGINTIILGYFNNSFDVGIYSAAIKVSLLITIPLDAINFIFAPIISEMYGKGQLDKLETMFKLVTKWVFLVSFPIFLVILGFSEPILRIFGAEFSVGAPALRILAAGYLVDSSVGSVGFMLTMAGRPRVNLANTFVLSIANIVLNIVLIPKYGVLGAAVAVATSTAAINLLRLGQVYYFLRMHPYRRDFTKPLLAGLIVLGIVWLFSLAFAYSPDEAILLRLLPALLFLPGYVLLLRAFRFSEEDKVVIDMIVQKLGPVVDSVKIIRKSGASR